MLLPARFLFSQRSRPGFQPIFFAWVLVTNFAGSFLFPVSFRVLRMATSSSSSILGRRDWFSFATAASKVSAKAGCVGNPVAALTRARMKMKRTKRDFIRSPFWIPAASSCKHRAKSLNRLKGCDNIFMIIQNPKIFSCNPSGGIVSGEPKGIAR